MLCFCLLVFDDLDVVAIKAFFFLLGNATTPWCFCWLCYYIRTLHTHTVRLVTGSKQDSTKNTLEVLFLDTHLLDSGLHSALQSKPFELALHQFVAAHDRPWHVLPICLQLTSARLLWQEDGRIPLLLIVLQKYYMSSGCSHCQEITILWFVTFTMHPLILKPACSCVTHDSFNW